MFRTEPWSEVLECLSLAHTHNRQRLLRHTLQHVPQGKWGELRGKPEFAALPPLLQQALKLAANRDPPCVMRGMGSVSAPAYVAAGGKLDAEEAAQLAAWEEATAAPLPATSSGAAGGPAAKRQRRGGGGEAAPAAAAAPAGAMAAAEVEELLVPWEITRADAARSSLFEECGRLQYQLSADPALNGKDEFFQAVTRFAHPTIAAALEQRVSWPLVL